MEIVWNNIVVMVHIGQNNMESAWHVAKTIATNVMRQEIMNQIIKSIVIAVIVAGKQFQNMEIALKNILHRIIILEIGGWDY